MRRGKVRELEAGEAGDAGGALPFSSDAARPHAQFTARANARHGAPLRWANGSGNCVMTTST